MHQNGHLKSFLKIVLAIKKGTRKALRKVGLKDVARRAGTPIVGRMTGRLIPYVGWALLAWDLWDNGEFINETAQGLREQREEGAH